MMAPEAPVPGAPAPTGPVPEAPRPSPRPLWRRPAVLLAIALDVVVAVGAIWALANGVSPIVAIAFAAILGIAPWSAIIDDSERPRRG